MPEIQEFHLRPVPKPVKAVKFDGSIDTCDLIFDWVQKDAVGQFLKYENDITVVLYGRGETYDLRNGYWLVQELSTKKFFIMGDAEFHQTYVNA